MMPLFWVVLWSMLPPLALSCGPDCCNVNSSSGLKNTSPQLKSLQCHNDYKSYVHCKWREHGNKTLQLWFQKGNQREPCRPYGAEEQHASEHRTVRCRYETRAFSIGIEHTAFFLENKTLRLCSSVQHKLLDLSLHLRARPPGNLSTHGAGDGGQRLTWSSPYPSSSSSSSSLNNHITYQLSYRTARQDNWTTEDVTNTSVKLEKRLFLPGRRYEARVRARASVGQWSDWSPVVTWRTEEEIGQSPSLHCVLDGEKEVMCSWEVSRELDHFITYQLTCRHNQTAAPERCCENSNVTSDLGGAVLRYSCSMTVKDPARLLVELLPALAAKSFKADKHIRPGPPQQVKVRQKDTNWMVEWTGPTASKPTLYYQVCYYRTQDPRSSVSLNISDGSTSLSIPGASLNSSQHYQVKVRSLVGPIHYEGIPSEWTNPVDWTSQEAIWSPTTLIYFTIGVFVAVAFLTLYCTIPVCQRRATLWVDSVPSPAKSKILSDIKSGTNWTLMQSESMTICKVMRLDSVSTCSSDALLWPTKDTEQMCLECLQQDKGCWKCDNLPLPAEMNNHSDTSSMNFSGPYIFCQSSEASCKSADVECEEKEREQETPSGDSASLSPGHFSLYGEGYVCLPGRSVFRSTQDLVSHSGADANAHRHDIAEQDQQCPDEVDVQLGLSEAASSHQLPAYTSGPFIPWPQGGTAQASGYCHLPAAFMRAAK